MSDTDGRATALALRLGIGQIGAGDGAQQATGMPAIPGPRTRMPSKKNLLVYASAAACAYGWYLHSNAQPGWGRALMMLGQFGVIAALLNFARGGNKLDPDSGRDAPKDVQ